jgi:hypothetical protein
MRKEKNIRAVVTMVALDLMHGTGKSGLLGTQTRPLAALEFLLFFFTIIYLYPPIINMCYFLMTMRH